jgi:hypothetical protein
MEYLKRASPQFVAAELDKLGLLDGADEVATTKLAEIAALRASDRVYEQVLRTRKMSLWVVALAMCAVIVVIAETQRFVLPEADGSQFMQLAGPTPEW